MYLYEFVRGYTDQEVRFSYFDPGDTKPHVQYEGIAKQGTPTSSPSWNIRRFYIIQSAIDSSYTIVRVQVLDGAWDDRATLAWL